ncbi:MAG: hypothetical protein WC596_02635 [Candidatus Shapirobacteria bacterium]
MLWFLVLLFGLFLKPVYAQDASVSAKPPTPTPNPAIALFAQYQNDYNYQRDLYQQAYLEYLNKKNIYTKYGTITTQQEKFDATKKALSARNNTLRAYLIALRVDLDKYRSVNTTETEKFQIELGKLESWCLEQNLIIDSLNNEEDVKKWIGDQFVPNFMTIRQATATALVLHENNQILTILNSLKSLTSDIKLATQNNLTAQSLLSSMPIKYDLVTISTQNAYTLTQTKQYSGNQFNDFYPNAKKEITKAQGYLVEIQNSLKSLVNKYVN